MDDVDNREEEFEKPMIAVCDLGELDWVKVKHNLILVNYKYIFSENGKSGS